MSSQSISEIEQQDKRWNDLHAILQGMDIPSGRFNDVNWLLRNMQIRNANHPSFAQAYDLCHQIKKEINRVTK
jgi:hypothetical protein